LRTADELVRVGGDGESLALVDDVLGLGLDGRLEQVVLAQGPAFLLLVDLDDALAGEEPLYGADVGHRAGVARHRDADVGQPSGCGCR